MLKSSFGGIGYFFASTAFDGLERNSCTTCSMLLIRKSSRTSSTLKGLPLTGFHLIF